VKYAIISDIHSNYAALEQVLEQIQTEKCDKIVCLGDIVGYGPYPNECVAVVKKYADIVIAGNHDYAAVDLLDLEYFNIYAQKAMVWTRSVLNEESKEYLSALPIQATGTDTFFVHATAISPERWGYILTPQQALINFDCFEQRCCFVGHSHLPVIFVSNGKKQPDMVYDREKIIEEGKRYIINVGSVGQPRDHSSLAAFGIFDSEKKVYQNIRVSYDVYTTQKAMMSLDFPEFLIERLKHGR